MIDFSVVKKVTISDGSVKKIADSSGNVLWKGDITFYVATSYKTFTVTVPSGSTWADAATIYNKSASSTNPFTIYISDYTVYFEFYYSGTRQATVNGVFGTSAITENKTYSTTST